MGTRLALGAYPQSCSECRKDTDHARALRKDWGCDSPTEHALDLWACHCDGSPACSRCHGTGQVSLHVCPRKIATNDIDQVIRYCVLAKDFGQWPVAGGALDQSQQFLDAFAVVNGEINRFESEQHG